MELDSQYLERWLERFSVAAGCGRLWIGFSGGLDSTVLLHLAAGLTGAQSAAAIRAVHVNHGLQREAADWVSHCERQCERLGISLQVVHAPVRRARGESLEAAAREARYRAFTSVLADGDLLLLAHHQRDQLETFLLQALRGAGPEGLAAMPACAALGPGFLMRPLLECDRTTLRRYAGSHGLRWVDDPSNASAAPDRNYLRLELLPRLEARWPSAASTVARSARLCAEAASLLGMLAEQDLAGRCDGSGRLDVSGLEEMGDARVRNLLRAWLRRRALPMPSYRKLERIVGDALHARPDRMPCVTWPGGQVRGYRRHLYAMAPLPPAPEPEPVAWDPGVSFPLPAGLGTLILEPGEGPGLAPWTAKCRLTVGFRRGGERLRLPGRRGSRALRNLLQEAGVAPWMRARLPLMFVEGRLAAVGGCWYTADFAAPPGGPALRLRWIGRPLLG